MKCFHGCVQLWTQKKQGKRKLEGSHKKQVLVGYRLNISTYYYPNPITKQVREEEIEDISSNHTFSLTNGAKPTTKPSFPSFHSCLESRLFRIQKYKSRQAF
ncbi:hypothetical protein V6N12_013671 [Hibiscus sabdariffa]|uniref:Uncharacterized protein n=1 Tax=Hibiscus sabdariffa TaxID=183260 RepID=A0ABR2A9R9_9ROSI